MQTTDSIFLNKLFKQRIVIRAIRTLFVGSALGVSCSISALAAPGLVTQGAGNSATADGANIAGTGNGNHGVLAQDGASIVLTNSAVTSAGILAEGVLADKGSSITLDNTTIGAAQDGSYGLVGSTGSTVNASNISVNTQGNVYVYQANGQDRVHGSEAVVAVDGATVTLDGVNSISTTGNFGGGLLSLIDIAAQPTLLQANGKTTIVTTGEYSPGAEAYQAGARLEASGLDVSTQGRISYGAYAHGGEVALSNSSFATEGGTAYGLLAEGATSSLSAANAKITTRGEGASGALSEAGARMELSDTQVTVSGAGASGLIASGMGSTLDAARVQVQTAGAMLDGRGATGVEAQFGSSLSVTGASTVQTEGDGAIGALAQTAPGLAGPTRLNLDGGSDKVSIQTRGANAAGVAAAGAQARVDMRGVAVRTAGSGSFGVLALGEGASVGGTGIDAAASGGDTAVVAAINGGQVELSNSTLKASGAGSAGVLTQGGEAGNSNRVSLASSTLNAQAEAIRAAGSVAQVDLSQGTSLVSGAGVVARAVSLNGQSSTLSINADGGVKLKGDVLAETGSVVNLALANQSSLTGGTSNGGTFDIDGTSRWDLTRNSDLASLRLNGGTVQFAAPASGFHTLTTGTLGGSGGVFGMNTVLNEGGAATQSDLLHVAGDASGQHRLAISNQGGTGAQTVGNGIKVVQVDGQSAPNTFALANSLQAGAYEYRLFQGGTDSASNWYLRSEYQNQDGGQPGGGGEGPGVPPAPSYRPAVPGYVLTPALNLSYGFDTLGRLHERVGDIHSLQKAGDLMGKDGVWARIGGNNLDAESGRFGANQQNAFVQFGKDWELARDAEGAHSNAGATVTLGSGNGRFRDSERAVDPSLTTRTGSVDTEAQSVGGYYTKYWADGSYFDGVGQVSRFSNKYSDITGVTGKQNGYGIGISGEVGKPFTIASNGLAIEPQAQLMYQYLNLDDFTDQVSQVRADSQDALRGRIGVRLFQPNATVEGEAGAVTPYITADVLHDFLSPGTTWVGGTGFERGLTKTWYEVGLGFTGNVNKNGEFYANVKYGQNIGGEQYRNVSGNVGYRYSW